jgi:ABC-type glycerol-3-phosphate transport system permease component
MTPKMKRLVSDTLASGGLHFLLTVTAAATLFRFFGCCRHRSNRGEAFLRTRPPGFPSEPTLQWYVQLIKEVNFLLHFRNSVLVSVCITVLSLFINSMAGMRLRSTGSVIGINCSVSPGHHDGSGPAHHDPGFSSLKKIGSC